MDSINSRLKIQKAHRTLLMIGIFSIIMLFAGLTSAYIVSKGSLVSKWDNIALPTMFYISTAIIIISSLSAQFSINYAKQDNFKMVNRYLLIAILLGCIFTLFQFLGWNTLVNQGKFFSGNNIASSYLYVLTVTHVVHLLAGIMTLIVVLYHSYNKKYTAENCNGLILSIRFWHFLMFLWIYIFLFLLLIN
tara:strand:+ start:25 stop:597 length:573 start_codon:yes stop_codon:yes gene_type:complete